jgi:hypothetical protein
MSQPSLLDMIALIICGKERATERRKRDREKQRGKESLISMAVRGYWELKRC